MGVRGKPLFFKNGVVRRRDRIRLIFGSREGSSGSTDLFFPLPDSNSTICTEDLCNCCLMPIFSHFWSNIRWEAGTALCTIFRYFASPIAFTSVYNAFREDSDLLSSIIYFDNSFDARRLHVLIAILPFPPTVWYFFQQHLILNHLWFNETVFVQRNNQISPKQCHTSQYAT